MPSQNHKFGKHNMQRNERNSQTKIDTKLRRETLLKSKKFEPKQQVERRLTKTECK